jgi:tRNA-splicing ligase RtcB
MERLDKRLYNWATILDDLTREQALRTASMPFIYPHMALMPDAHLGKGATVGSVIPTIDTIMPAAVGVDIGCGMIAQRTQFTQEDLFGRLPKLREAIEKAIPLSAGGKNQTLGRESAKARVGELELLEPESAKLADQLVQHWRLQLGSLGSGNHFIEIVLDEIDRVWIFLHSGSRGVGNKIAQHHIQAARELAERYWITLPDPDLAYLISDDGQFWDYIRDLQWAQRFAWLNREEMAQRVAEALGEYAKKDVHIGEEVHCHHNYTVRERHFGKDVWLSRKGAISAKAGELGLIPGSMGAASYVVEGLGNRLALDSAPHGAGRVHSRTVARKTFTHEDLRKRMADRQIEWRDSAAFLDEHPDAYKSIDQVMLDARDLVAIKHEFRQVLNVKGQ